jgi:hypothetical protein
LFDAFTEARVRYAAIGQVLTHLSSVEYGEDVRRASQAKVCEMRKRRGFPKRLRRFHKWEYLSMAKEKENSSEQSLDNEYDSTSHDATTSSPSPNVNAPTEENEGGSTILSSDPLLGVQDGEKEAKPKASPLFDLKQN